MRLDSIVLAISLFAILFLNSCDSREIKTEKQVFSLNIYSPLTSLDPAFARSQNNIWLVNQLFNGLVSLDKNLQPVPSIAKRWTYDKDNRSYTFVLRDDIFFHKHFLFPDSIGRKVIANDFVYSFQRIIDPKTASPGAWIFNDKIKNNASIYAPNDSTLVIELTQDFPAFISLLSMQYCSVVPQEIVEHYGKDFRANPIGTGPFQLKLWKENERLILWKNEMYFEKEGDIRLPYIDAVMFSFISDKQSEFLSFLRGELDLVSNIDASYKDDLLSKNGSLKNKYKEKINIVSQNQLNTEYLGFLVDPVLNKNHPLLNKNLRKAINFSIDREKMMLYLRNNIGEAGNYGFIPRGLPGFGEKTIRGYSFHADSVQYYLNKAGYPSGKGLETLVLYTTPSYKDLTEFIAASMNEQGIKTKVELNPGSSLREMISKSQVSFFRASWIADYPDAENYLSLFTSNNFAPNGPNYTHFSNHQYDQLYQKALLATNDSLRTEIYLEMNQLLMEEAPVVILYYDQVLLLLQKRVKNFESNALNLLDLRRVQVESSKLPN